MMDVLEGAIRDKEVVVQEVALEKWRAVVAALVAFVCHTISGVAWLKVQWDQIVEFLRQDGRKFLREMTRALVGAGTAAHAVWTLVTARLKVQAGRMVSGRMVT